MSVEFALLAAGVLSGTIYAFRTSLNRLYQPLVLIETEKAQKNNEVAPVLMGYGRATGKLINILADKTRKSVLEKLYGPSRKIARDDLLGVRYYCDGKWHEALVEHKRGVASISKIEAIRLEDSLRADSAEWVDVSDEVRPLLGPNEDCWGKCLTPLSINYSMLKIHVFNGLEISTILVAGHKDIAGVISEFKSGDAR